MTNPQYLGDGVYASLDQWGRLVLTTGNHQPNECDDMIVLEPEVIAALVRYLENAFPKMTKQESKSHE
jgi:hypothetical protein